MSGAQYTLVITGRPINDVLAEVAFQTYLRTGVRVQHVEFNWTKNAAPANHELMIASVSVTSIGGPL